MAYRAILFDLFDTLVSFDRKRLPTLQINGRVVHSTVGRLHEVLRPHAPQVTLETLYQAMLDSWQEAERRRAVDHREVAAPERFAHVFRCLGLDPRACPPQVMQDLLDAHRHSLSGAAEFPPHHRPLLADLGRRHRLAVVSNFDYTPTALGILESAGVAALFETIVVSDAVGWRKPAPAIFHTALERLGIAPAEALFVGDRADIDVAGAQGVAMPVAWLNRDREALPASVAPPDFEIHDLDELRRIPGVAERI